MLQGCRNEAEASCEPSKARETVVPSCESTEEDEARQRERGVVVAGHARANHTQTITETAT